MKNPECERAVVHVTNNNMIMVATPPMNPNDVMVVVLKDIPLC